MDRRYDQVPRDRYMYSRGRFDDRANARDEGYYRRDDGPWTSRYPPFPPPTTKTAAAATRRHHDGYSHERRDPYSRRQSSPILRHDDNKAVRHLMDDKRKDDERKQKVDVPVSPTTTTTTIKVEKEQVKEIVKPVKVEVYKEAVVTFDSDDEQVDDVKPSPNVVVDCGHDSDETVTEKEKKTDDLPEAWAKHVSEKGETYYYNKQTRESVWDKPTTKKPVEEGVNKRKFVLPDREPRTYHPYPRRYDHHRPLPPPPMPYEYRTSSSTRSRYHHPHPRSTSPPSDRYYRQPPSRDPWLHHPHHSPPPYRHHLDYAPLPPLPPPPRWISARRLDFDRREPLPPYMHRNTRDYR